MVDKSGYIYNGFGSPQGTVSELGLLVGKLSFLVRSRLWLQIVIGMFFGIVIGISLSPAGYALVAKSTAELVTGWLVLPGHIFLALIQMIMIPLVVSSIVLGVADTNDPQKLKKMGVRIAPYFVVTTTVAVLIGVSIVTLIRPGEMIDPALLENLMTDTALEKTTPPNSDANESIHDKIVNLIPANPINAALEESMLQLVVFAILIGIALVSIDDARAKPLLDLARSLQEISMEIVSWAMLLAPYAVLGLLAQITMQAGIDALIGMSAYVVTVLSGLALLLVFYSVIASVVGGYNPIKFLGDLKEVQLLAFSTSSSAAVMPMSIRTAEQKLGVDSATADFIVPLGATINMDGTALYQVVAAVFLTQVFAVDLSSGELVLLIATTVGASIGSPSTPGVGIVILATILTNIGIPASGIALIIGVDRILDMSRTAINVTGDLTACIVIDKWLSKADRV